VWGMTLKVAFLVLDGLACEKDASIANKLVFGFQPVKCELH
jgi:hypothetical protein